MDPMHARNIIIELLVDPMHARNIIELLTCRSYACKEHNIVINL